SSSPSCAAVPAMQMAEDKLRTTCDPSAGFLWSTVSHRSNALANVLEGCPSGLWCLIRNQMCESTGGSNPSLSAISSTPSLGGMTERPKVHDWKSCVLKGTEGSNPSPSAARRCRLACVILMVPGDADAVNPARPGREQR